MSFRKERQLALASPDHIGEDMADLIDLYTKALDRGMHGLCFSPYEEGQTPGDQLSEEQIRRRMEIIKPHIKSVRTFSCTEGNELIAKIAKEYGLQTMVGAWLGDDLEKNQEELDGLYKLADAGLVDIAAVGNEVLYRKELTEDQLLGYLNQAKSNISNASVGYVDAYYEFVDHPAVTEACDVILANCYPFWEGCPIEYSLIYMKEMYHKAAWAGKGKRVIITETGWPDQGTGIGGSIPTKRNAMTYFINAQNWSAEEEIEMFYFSSFDESWKVGAEGDVGAYWGIWDKNGAPKFDK
ncbi:MAG: glycosyl hydrolase family 17 protein [Bacteroidota bacterium]